jgi:transposase
MTYQEEILKLHKEGKSYNQIKEILGCSKGTISYYLGAGQKEKTLNRTKDIRSRISKYIQEYKQSKSCADCKENYPYWMMDLDHLENKKFNLSAYKTSTLSLDTVKLEINKCEVVCANCHRNRTHLRLIKNGNSLPNINQYYK